MKNAHYLTAVLFLANLASLCFAVEKKGGETGNGGTIIIDGDTYRLSDLDFIATPGKPLTLDQSLIDTIHSDSKVLDQGTYLIEFGAGYIAKVLNPLIEYRFVGTLPTECMQIESGAGCAQGSITYLVAKQFQSLSLEEKAETLLEVRAGAMTGDPAINKAYANAIHGLVFKYKTEATTIPFVVRYTDEELAGINKVIEMSVKLETKPWFQVVQGGGQIILQSNAYNVPPPKPPTVFIVDSTVDVKSTITVTGGPVHLDHAVVSESILIGSEVFLDHVEVIGTREGMLYAAQPIHWENRIVQGQGQ